MPVGRELFPEAFGLLLRALRSCLSFVGGASLFLRELVGLLGLAVELPPLLGESLRL